MSATVGCLGRLIGPTSVLHGRSSTIAQAGFRYQFPNTLGCLCNSIRLGRRREYALCNFFAAVIAVVLFVFVTARHSPGSVDRGTIAGTVLDGSGGAIANAKLTATDTETGATYSATTAQRVATGCSTCELPFTRWQWPRPASRPWRKPASWCKSTRL